KNGDRHEVSALARSRAIGKLCCGNSSQSPLFLIRHTIGSLEPLRSAIDSQSDSYRANFDAMSASVDRLRKELKRSTEGGGEKYVQRHVERGKLLPRERVELLLDEGSYFLEIAPLAGIGLDDEIPGARVIGGIGLVAGRECMIVANEATAKGGSTGEA